MLILRQSAGGSFSRTPRSPPRRIWNDLLVKSPGSSNSRPSAKLSATFAFSAEKSRILHVFAFLFALRAPENLRYCRSANFRYY
jgi:hypothetical protein